MLLRRSREARPDAFARRPLLAQELEPDDVHAFDARGWSGLRQIEGDEAEAGLERDLRRAQGMGRLAGTDPEQPPQVDVVRAGIEGVFRIDERA